MGKKPFFSLALCGILTISFSPCQQAGAQGNWVKKADFPTSSRNYGLGFSIGSKGYFGMGQKQTKPFIYKAYNDFWEYDPETNIWTQKSDFPGEGRLRAKGFSVNNKIYIGFGHVIAAYGASAGSNNYQVDLYEFNPAENKWSKKSNSYLGGADICFVINDTMYTVNPEYRTLNKYNPLTDTWFESKWEKNAAAPGYEDITGTDICFSSSNKEYFVTSIGKKDKHINQLWELDPRSVTWHLKSDLPNPGNDTVTMVSIGDKDYAIRGGKEVLEYVPETDSWTAQKGIPPEHKSYCPAFSIKGRSYGFSKYEFWEFIP